MYDNSGETHSAVHGDLWRTKTDRAQANEYDIAGENLRKLISKDDSGENTGNPAKVSDGLKPRPLRTLWNDEQLPVHPHTPQGYGHYGGAKR